MGDMFDESFSMGAPVPPIARDNNVGVIRVDNPNGGQYVKLTYEATLDILYKMCEKLEKDGIKYGIAIGYGGYPLGKGFVDYFRAIREDGERNGFELYTMRTSGYDGNRKLDKPRITRGLGKSVRKKLEGKCVGVIDDISDSGDNCHLISGYLLDKKKVGVDKVIFATVVKKKNTAFHPDIFGLEVNDEDWTIFPLEELEDGRWILKDHGKKVGVELLRELNYSQNQIDILLSKVKLGGRK